MNPLTRQYCEDAGPFRAVLASIPCLILAANGEIIAESDDQDVAEAIADALNAVTK